MNKLPTEILENVFVLLDQQDKVQCMLVCQHWDQIIKSSCLFETICITRKATFNELRAIFKKNATLRLQTKRILVLFDVSSNFDFVSFFPNIQMLLLQRFATDIGSYELTQKQIQQKDHKPNNTSMLCLIETFQCTVANTLLYTTLCPTLKTLKVAFYRYKRVKTTILPLLKNAPCLTNLTMQGFSFSLDKFEFLHRQAPQLKYVDLQCTNLQLNLEEVLNADIIPTSSITVFKITTNNNSSANGALPLIYYICRKYPKVADLKLQPFNLASRIDNELQRLLKEGLELLFSTVRYQLQSLAVIIPNVLDDIFNILDRNNCKIKNINIGLIKEGHIQGPRLVKSLIQSNQVNYINSLWLGNCLVQKFDWLKNLIKLKELTLSYFARISRYPVYCSHSTMSIILDEIINSCLETLEKLSIYGFSIQLSSKFITGSCNQSITHLELIGGQLPLCLDLYITHHIPRLSHLIFKSHSMVDNSFNLPNHHLAHIDVLLHSEKSGYKLLLVTGADKFQWFELKYYYNDYCAYNEYCDVDTTVPFYKPYHSTEDPEFTPNIIILCASVKKFGFFNCARPR